MCVCVEVFIKTEKEKKGNIEEKCRHQEGILYFLKHKVNRRKNEKKKGTSQEERCGAAECSIEKGMEFKKKKGEGGSQFLKPMKDVKDSNICRLLCPIVTVRFTRRNTWPSHN